MQKLDSKLNFTPNIPPLESLTRIPHSNLQNLRENFPQSRITLLSLLFRYRDGAISRNFSSRPIKDIAISGTRVTRGLFAQLACFWDQKSPSSRSLGAQFAREDFLPGHVRADTIPKRPYRIETREKERERERSRRTSREEAKQGGGKGFGHAPKG